MCSTPRLAVGLVAVSLLVGATVRAELALNIAKPKSDEQRKMLEVIRRWEDTYNTDVEKMIRETYAPDAEVVFTGASAKGHEQFLRLEKAIVGAAPGRRMRIDRIFFSGDDVAIVEAVELDTARPDFFSPWCAILTFREGKIIQDHTYLEPNRWPGIEAAKGIPTPGGLGAAHLVPGAVLSVRDEKDGD